ncbi:MAG: aldo/keto reductase [Oscillospiraceae bacterium]|jgi:aryl-alcohol dehydrogenase-like predicted oxidoreductase|nr:aldo/keto reductase [Oscillospiraceae bacterium]
MRKIPPLNVSVIGYGCMGLSHAYGSPPSRAAAKQVIHEAMDLGIDFFDTANLYGYGENEMLVGETLKPVRSKIFLASKGGLAVRDANGNLTRGIDSSPDNIKRSCEESLKRLQTDYLDLYYLHRWDKNTPIEDCVMALADLVREGKIRRVGLCEISAETLRKANDVHPIAALQCEYSLWTRDPEAGTLEACSEIGAAFVCYSPIARGFLSNAVADPETLPKGDLRRNMPRFAAENYKENRALLSKYLSIADEVGCTPSQLALAWLLHRPWAVCPIPGTTSITHLRENAGAAEVKLSQEVTQRLEQLINSETISGARYNEVTMAELDR